MSYSNEMQDRVATKRGGSQIEKLRRAVRRLQSGHDRRSLWLQGAFFFIDIAILAFFIMGPYLRSGPSYLIVDYLIAIWIGFELMTGVLLAKSFKSWILRSMTWVDLFILATLLFPNLLYNFAFLRAMRIWAIGQSTFLRELLRFCRCSHLLDVVRACINLIVFLFIVTGFVYTSFFYRLEGGEGFVDALYFTVATVTTTGFGDITLPGTLGKLTSVVTMIVGISLFVRLAQAVVRPHKVTFPCPECGLQRHEADAVHCKACGHLLNIPDEGS